MTIPKTTTIIAFLVGAVIALVLAAIIRRDNAQVLESKWGDTLLTVRYAGVIYDTVPREEVVTTERASTRQRGYLENRDFDVEYLIERKKFHSGRIAECMRIISSHEWNLEAVEKKLAAYRKMLGYDGPKKEKEQSDE